LPWCEPAYQAVDWKGSVAQVTVLAQESHTYDWLSQRLSNGELHAQLLFWRECMRDIDRLDIVAFDWQPSAQGISLQLRLGDRQIGSDEAVERLLDECSNWPSGTQVTIEAVYETLSLAFMAKVPACGYAVYGVQGCPEPREPTAPVRGGPNWLENEYLRVEVDAQGELSLTDRTTGRIIAGVHRFEDCADIGDLYDFCPLPVDDEELRLRESSCCLQVAPGGTLAALRVHNVYQLPKSLASDGWSRSSEQVELRATSHLRLRTGSPILEILTTIDNTALDHRLRVCFPSGVVADTVHADGHFAVVSRPAVAMAAPDWCQPPSSLAAHHTWFAADDGRSGMAVFSEGLPEHEAVPMKGGLTLALTLLRAVGELSRSGLTTRPGQAGPSRPTPDAQCTGIHRFRYGVLLYPHDPWTARLPHLAASFDAPLVAQALPRSPGHLPPALSLVTVEGRDLLLTALKRSEAGDRVLVRFYNAGEEGTEALVRFGLPVGRVHRSTAEEIERTELDPVRPGEYPLEVQPAEIVSLLVDYRPVNSSGQAG
jgi:hypothetical protein